MKTMKLMAYLSPYAQIKAHELHDASEEQLKSALFITAHEPGHDYTPVGEVEARLHLFESSDIIGNKVASLRTLQAELRARCEREATRLEGEVQSLLCLTNDPKDLK
jgi:hypothetical protein